MSHRFLSIGECMLELSPAGPGQFALGFAGDTFNTAWYLARLSVPQVEVAYLSAIGDDEPSRNLAAFLRDSGITPELAVRKGGHVGLYMISLRNGERSFSYWRDTSAARTLADDLDRLPGLKPGDTAYFSGITLAILPDAGRARLLSALTRARAEGVTVMFDPNLRPRLWPSAAAMCAAIMEGAAVADIVLPSYEDEAGHFGDTDKEATADRYAAQGCGLVVVKDGPGAVLIRKGEERLEVMPDRVAEIVDTTAAGDAFNAGFWAALHQGASLAEAARAGCRLSARVIGQRGALVALD